MKQTAFVLTTEYNEYDQYGEYFLAVFSNKPTEEQLLSYDVPSKDIQHVLNGGGRQNIEWKWFFLKEVPLE